MLNRIVLIIAIIGALAAAVVNVVVVKDRITTLTNDRNTQRSQKEQAQTELASTKKTLAKTQSDLTQTQQQLADAKTAEKKAEDVANAQKKRADDLSDQLTKVTQERDDAQAQLAAYKATGKTPKEIASLVKQIKDDNSEIAAINDEKAVLTRTVARLNNQINELIGTNYVVTLRPDLKGMVLTVDPKWGFVVLNIGDNQGVLQDGELLVSRDGRLVAKVIVRSVEKNRSIANIMPGWKLGDIYEGDVVTPAHPAS
jgi:Tfp pilus assembly major pilin PilA